ncbi:ABC transporter permease [Cohnella sp. REN36]|uniref:ABC transporter permease n=1 Tax=Cohnella sp. REN36 TaxID=2887347 RepID=UPI001D15E3F7|nr:ABC transporter permease [Cohnella sp. REN36]MCC3374346.1 ABC transporter permease [Cohnella sp. REN36]
MLKKGIGWTYAALVMLFLYAPILVLMAMSFNASKYNALPFEFSMRWYRELAGNDKLIDATLTSVYIAAGTAVICVVLATMLMLWAVRTNSKLKRWIDSLVILPLTIPWLILGLSLLLLVSAAGIDKNFMVLLIGHVVVSLPYAVLVIKARLQSMDLTINEASASLGANEWTTVRRITLPLLFPAMLAGGFLAFVISFDNFILSYFLIPGGSSTLPIEIYSSIKFGFTPEINAVSTVMLTATTLLIVLIATIMRSSLKFFLK